MWSHWHFYRRDLCSKHMPPDDIGAQRVNCACTRSEMFPSAEGVVSPSNKSAVIRNSSHAKISPCFIEKHACKSGTRVIPGQLTTPGGPASFTYAKHRRRVAGIPALIPEDISQEQCAESTEEGKECKCSGYTLSRVKSLCPFPACDPRGKLHKK